MNEPDAGELSRSSARRVSKEEFAKVPYIHNVPVDGRTVFLASYIDGTDKRWNVNVPHARELTSISAEPVESCYYAESIVDDYEDLYVEIMDVVARHYSFDSVLGTSLELVRRILNCSVIVEKYFVCLGLYRKTKNGSNEKEY